MDVDSVKDTLKRVWWAFAIQGALAIVFGLVCLFYSGATLRALLYVFGVFALLNGILAIVAAVRAGEANARWGWLAAAGVVGVAAGVVCFLWPNLVALGFVYFVAVWAILLGVAEIAFALQWPDTLAHPWLAALAGVLSVIFGLLLAIWPHSGETGLMWLIGIYAILYGATMLYYAYRLQALWHEVRTTRQDVGGIQPAS
jgi:uncharacterized membrane protein HdeD (DUF308 family)